MSASSPSRSGFGFLSRTRQARRMTMTTMMVVPIGDLWGRYTDNVAD
jgi:hypothetical protein